MKLTIVFTVSSLESAIELQSTVQHLVKVVALRGIKAEDDIGKFIDLVAALHQAKSDIDSMSVGGKNESKLR
jgi:hypothetical protein